jgi:hypothetical protein
MDIKEAKRLIENVINNHELSEVALYKAEYDNLVEDLAELLKESK